MSVNEDLSHLGVFSVDQENLERDVTNTASEYIAHESREIEKKRLQKVRKEISSVKEKIRRLDERIDSRLTKISVKENLRKQLSKFRDTLQSLQSDENDIKRRLNNEDSANASGIGAFSTEELERQELIRTGKVTPFRNLSGLQKEVDFDDESSIREAVIKSEGTYYETAPHLSSEPSNIDHGIIPRDEKDEYVTVDAVTEKVVTAAIDDGDDLVYRQRLNAWCANRKELRDQASASENNKDRGEFEGKDEWLLPHPSKKGQTFEGGFTIPGDIRPHLFRYQVTCVQWLWELYCQEAGGIIGDEMGLGKTIQIVSFLSSLHHSGKFQKPALIVCPATLMKQWVNEFHTWWAPLRVVVLHATGSGQRASREKRQYESDASESEAEESKTSIKLRGASSSFHRYAKNLVESVFTRGHILITTYAGLRIYGDLILPREWGYCVLDEGHKIRNPDSEISISCKQIRTVNRIILSGTPIQNNLTELWNLFDFVFPGRLGTLPVFQNQFALPINIGGYANASNVQVQTAYKCACMLRDLISPYLLRRMKLDVAADLPKKSEQVLFCKLTPLQRKAYQDFLQGSDMQKILNGKRQMLYGIDILRKICNHPDLVTREYLLHKEDYNYGDPEKSGKLKVVRALLTLWKKQGHRTLLFSQTRQMLDILEIGLKDLPDVHYCRMDGSTSIALRQDLVDNFNKNEYFDVFLLTTRVGGLGVNLTGADRVILFDPDWNPSTDAQARERAWRLGQKKDVVVYRLMTAGTIEEKIYHRQIFKQFLTNKILKDPKQRRFFKMTDLHDLFTLGDNKTEGTETGSMFLGSERVLRKDNSSRNGNEADDIPARDRKKPKIHDKGKKVNSSKVFEKMGIASMEKYKPPQESNVTKTNSDSTLGDDSVLDDIFASAGIQSTLKHDDIMEASQTESILVEKEATRVANEALRAVSSFRRPPRQLIPPQQSTNVPGTSKPSGPITSSTLLARLKQRR